MYSKQALEAYRRLCRHLDYDNDDYMFNGGYEEDNEVIENALKDLEVLEILKNESDSKRIIERDGIVSFHLDMILTADNYNKIKEWLENGK